MPTGDSISYPDILFKIANSLYCVSSRHVISISPLPKYNKVPGSAEGVSGIVKFREYVVPLIDMRVIFGIPTLEQEYKSFVDMLEMRKTDHINWVNELERCVQTGDKFKLATDPHKCAFGKWYDRFQADSQIVEFHMRKIEEPHSKLHESALDIENCSSQEDGKPDTDRIAEILREIKTNYMPTVLNLMEEAKSVFASTYHSMLIIIQDGRTQLGMLVDDVLSIEELDVVPADTHTFSFNHSEYINVAKQINGQGELILEMDDGMLMEHFRNIQIDKDKIIEEN